MLIAPAINSVSSIVVVVPVKDNQAGIDRLLTSFVDELPKSDYPLAVVIVDNASATPVTVDDRYLQIYPAIRVTACEIVGLPSARNHGVDYVRENFDAPWILFIDSDCLFTGTTISGFVQASKDPSLTGAVGYQAAVDTLGHDWVSNYYRDTELLVPFGIKHDDGVTRPQFLVGACHLVYLPVFEVMDGYNVDYRVAAEDYEFSYRLSKMGMLAFADAHVQHDYLNGKTAPTKQDLLDFMGRHYRYTLGKGLLMAHQMGSQTYQGMIDDLSTGDDSVVSEPPNAYFYLDYLEHISMVAARRAPNICATPVASNKNQRRMSI